MIDPLRRLVPTAVRRRYALKFVLVLCILGLSVGAIGYLATGQLADETRTLAHDDQETLAEREAQNVRNWDERNRLIVGEIATSLENTDRVDSAIDRAHTDYVGLEIHEVDLDSATVHNSTNDDYDGAALEEIDESWDALAEGGRGGALRDGPVIVGTYATEVVTYDRSGETPVIAYAASIGEGQRLAIVEVNLDLYAEELIDDDGQLSYLVSTEGDERTVLADPRGESFFESYDEAVDLSVGPGETDVRSIGAPGGTVGSSVETYSSGEYGGEDYLAATTRVSSELPWHVVVHTPETQAYGVVQDVQRYGVYASVGGILLIGLIGGVVGRNTSRSIDRLTTKAKRMEEGDLEVSFETGRIDNIGRLYDGFANMRDALTEQIDAAERAREEAEAERERVERINDRLERTADDYASVMQAAADGDLTARMAADGENEAMSEIAAEFNAMLAELEATVAELTAFANTVATASEEVTASSEEVRNASAQVSESIQAISDGADRQNESLQSVTREMSDLSTTTEEIAASSNEVATLAERTAETGDVGQAAARDAIDGMARLEDESAQAVAEIERLESDVTQIDELIDSIAEIAKQTNMLALNANIEASRSPGDGDSNDGFGAVAAEVKSLSEEARTAAEEAETRLEAIRDQTERSAREVQRTSEEIADQADAVREAASALDEIATYARETNTGIQDISAATEQQAASTQEIVAMVDRAATISDETTAEAENVAAAAEEQTTALTEVSDSASRLAGQATALSEALERFETDAGPVDGERDDVRLEFAGDEAVGEPAARSADGPDDDAADAPAEEAADDGSVPSRSDSDGRDDNDRDDSARDDGFEPAEPVRATGDPDATDQSASDDANGRD